MIEKLKIMRSEQDGVQIPLTPFPHHFTTGPFSGRRGPTRSWTLNTNSGVRTPGDAKRQVLAMGRIRSP